MTDGWVAVTATSTSVLAARAELERRTVTALTGMIRRAARSGAIDPHRAGSSAPELAELIALSLHALAASGAGRAATLAGVKRLAALVDAAVRTSGTRALRRGDA